MSIAEIRNQVETLKEIKEVLSIDKYDSTELEELVLELSSSKDFICELDGAEYRFIHENAIEDTFAKSAQEMIEDCYGIDKLPSIISRHIDWDGIVDDCRMDGYGHHFSSYDDSEENVEDWYIFRTN